MTSMVERRRIEVLVDSPLARQVVSLAREAGIAHYTLLQTLSGAGAHGTWSDDQITGAQAKVLFLAITGDDKLRQFTDLVTPLLESHGLVLMVSSVNVIRGEKFS